MAVTNVRGRQLKDDDVLRQDLNTTVSGSAVIRKVIAGTNISISSTGVDAGTGDVTISSSYTETDTLATVTGRGATTATQVTLNGGFISTTGSFSGAVTTSSYINFSGTTAISTSDFLYKVGSSLYWKRNRLRSYIERTITGVSTAPADYNKYYEIGSFAFSSLEGVFEIDLTFNGSGYGQGSRHIVPVSYAMDYLTQYSTGLTAINGAGVWLVLDAVSQTPRHLMGNVANWELQMNVNNNTVQFRIVIKGGTAGTAIAYVKISHNNDFDNCTYTELTGTGVDATAYSRLPSIASGINGTTLIQNNLDVIGDVAIGLITPLAKLHVSKDSGAATVRLLQLDNSNATYSQNVYLDMNTSKDVLWGQGSAGGGTFWSAGTRGFGWSINGSRIVTYDQNGNVGINTGSPTRKLHVVSSDWDNTLGAGVIIENSNTVGSGLTLRPTASAVTNGTNGWAIYAGGPGAAIFDGNLGFWAHGTNEARLVLQRGGNVGIGTYNPGAKVHISGGGLQVGDSVTTSINIRYSRTSSSIAADAHYFVAATNTPVQSWIEGGFMTAERAGTVTASNSGYPYYEEYSGQGSATAKSFGFVNLTTGNFTGANILYALTLKRTGQVQLPQYTGSASFAGTAAGLLAFDSSGNLITLATNTYLTANQTITLTGNITGSGTTSIATTIANGVVTNAMLVNSSFNIGTTSISLGRASAAQSLTGITSIDGYASHIRSGIIADLNNSWLSLGTSIDNALQVFRYASTATNSPEVLDNANWVMNIYSHPSGGTASYGHQISGVDNNNIYVRYVQNGSFGAWYKIWTSGTLTNLNQLTNGPGYITGNQTITLSGAVTGSGATAITTTLANSVVGIANLSATGTASASTYLRGDNTWASIPSANSTTRYDQSFVATAGQTVITVNNALAAGYFDVYINGVKANSDSFTFSGTTITLVDGLAAGDIVDVINYVTVSQVGTAYGTSYSMTSGAGTGTAVFDTIERTGPAVYEVVFKGNPNGAGSGSYLDFVYGKLVIGTGWNGSTVAQFIQFIQESPMPRTMYGSGGGNLTVNAVFLASGTEYNNLTAGSTYTVRFKVSGYNTAYTGASSNIYLKQIG